MLDLSDLPNKGSIFISGSVFLALSIFFIYKDVKKDSFLYSATPFVVLLVGCFWMTFFAFIFNHLVITVK